MLGLFGRAPMRGLVRAGAQRRMSGGRLPTWASGAAGLEGEQLALWETAAAFAESELLPMAREWDETETFPVEVLRKLGALGFGGLYVPSEKGGSELGRVGSAIVLEALATGCVSTTAYLSIHNMCCWMLSEYGSAQLIERWLPGLLSIEQRASYCLTEPSSGSDAGSLRTTARLEGGEWVLNGSKAFISGGGESAAYLVMCRTEDGSAAPGPKGVSCVLVPGDAQGLSFGAKEKKLGWNSQPTRAVFFDNCRVPAENLVGDRGSGFRMAMAALDGGRVNIAACSLGGAGACLEGAIQHTTQRKQFGSAIAAFQHTQFELAAMASSLTASRLMVRSAAGYLDEKHPDRTVHAAMAKKFATDCCFDVCNRSLQMLGGYGYLKDYPIQRYLRDVRVHQILEGTNEIMSTIISRRLLE